MSQRQNDFDECFYGSATVGERGQIVIPANARADLGIKPGDKLLIMKHPIYEGLMLSKFEAVQGFLDEFKRNLERIDSVGPDEEEDEE